MNAQVTASIIGGAATIVAAVIGVAVVRRSGKASDKEPPASVAQSIAFADVSIDPDAKSDWSDGSGTDSRVGGVEWEAQWRFRRVGYDEEADLPLRVTLRNKGESPIVVTRIGVEVVLGHNEWYTGIYYGQAPKARKIRSVGAYDLRLGDDKVLASAISRVMRVDPDSDEGWIDVDVVCAKVLPKPLFVEGQAPLVYTLNLKGYDKGMPTHAVLRMWLCTDAGELRSDDIVVTFGR
jgi:hypothetical protein